MSRRQTLSTDPARAILDALEGLDVAFLDALARRERGTKFGRLARGVALSLRLELDSAALLLEPLAVEIPLARLLGDTLVGPRAKRVTRARTDGGDVELLASSVSPEDFALLVCARALLAPREDREASLLRCRVAERSLEGRHPSLALTLEVAKFATHVLSFENVSPEVQDGLIAKLDASPVATDFEALVRAGLAGILTARARPDVSEREIRKALRIAERSGYALFESRLLVLYGTSFVDGGDADEAEAALARAETLLEHGELPSLLHLTAQTRGAVAIRAGKYDEAATFFTKAKLSAREERLLELEGASAMNEALARIAGSDRTLAIQSANELTEARLAGAAPRIAVLAHLARALAAFVAGDRTAAELESKRGAARADRAAREMTPDVHVLAAVLRVLLGGDPRREHDRVRAETQGRLAGALFWFDLVGAGLSHLASRGDEADARAALRTLRDSLS